MGFSKWYFVGILFLATSFLWFLLLSETPNGVLSVSFLDVGQGDAVLITAPNKNQVLIDAGPPNRAVLRALRKEMPFYDRFIDVLIATHPDQDHIGGFADVLASYNTGLFIESGLSSGTNAFASLEKSLGKEKARRIIGKRGMEITLDEGVTLSILFPDRDVSGWESNDASLITRLIYGEIEFLFTGDAPEKIENYLVQIDNNIESDVLKTGHHGSKTSTGPAILGNVKPKFVVISSGEDNSYGHPHKEVLERLENFGAEIFRTDELGTVTFETDGGTLKVN